MMFASRRSLLSVLMPQPVMDCAPARILKFASNRWREIARHITFALLLFAQIAVGIHWAQHSPHEITAAYEQIEDHPTEGDADGPDCAVCQFASFAFAFIFAVVIALVPFQFTVVYRAAPVVGAMPADTPAGFRSRAPPRA